MSDFPATTPKPCSDCPWRTNATAGWLGPYTAQEWIDIAHGESAIACHQTIVADDTGTGDWEHPNMRQCRGAASFRENVAKNPRNPTIETGPASDAIFCSNAEFLAHHDPKAKFICGHCRMRVVFVPGSNDRRTYWRHIANPDGCRGLAHQGNRRRVFVTTTDDWRLNI